MRSDTCKVATNRGIKTQLRKDITDLMYRNTNIDLEEYEGNFYLNTGDWINHFSYGVFDGEKLELKYYRK